MIRLKMRCNEHVVIIFIFSYYSAQTASNASWKKVLVASDGDEFYSIHCSKEKVFVGSRNQVTEFLTTSEPSVSTTTINCTVMALKDCKRQGFPEIDCQNYVTNIKDYNDDCLIICGTNAMAPTCWIRNKKNLSIECDHAKMNGFGMVSMNRNCSSDMIQLGSTIVAAVSVDIYCQNRLLVATLPQKCRVSIPISMNWLSPPDVLAIFSWKRFVYVVFNELSKYGHEHTRIGRIHASDIKCSHPRTRHKIVKRTLECIHVNKTLDNMASSVVHVGDHLVASFHNGTMSNICIYEVESIHASMQNRHRGNMSGMNPINSIFNGTIADKIGDGSKDKNIRSKGSIVLICPARITQLSAYNYKNMLLIYAISETGDFFELIKTNSTPLRLVKCSVIPKFQAVIGAQNWNKMLWVVTKSEVSIRDTIVLLDEREDSSRCFNLHIEPDFVSNTVESVSTESEISTHEQLYMWSEWSKCSSPCNMGVRNRTRRCKHGTCSDKEFNICNIDPCEVEIRIYGEWTSWMTTQDGMLVRYQPRCEANVPLTSTLKSSLRKYEKKIHTAWLSWEQWSSCSSTCGNGFRTRMRRKAKACIPKFVHSESKPCSSPHCNADELVEWTDENGLQWRMLKCSLDHSCYPILATGKESYGFTTIWIFIFCISAFLFGFTCNCLILWTIRETKLVKTDNASK